MIDARCFGWVGASGGRPPPRPSPTSCAGEGGATHLLERDRILPLSSRSLRGEGVGGWGTDGAVRCLSWERIHLSPRFLGGEAGRGGAPRAQPDPFRRAMKFSPLREERTGRGRGRGTPRTQFSI